MAWNCNGCGARFSHQRPLCEGCRPSDARLSAAVALLREVAKLTKRQRAVYPFSYSPSEEAVFDRVVSHVADIDKAGE